MTVNRMKILDAAATRAALPFDKLIEAVDIGFRGAYSAPLRHHHHLHNTAGESGVLLLMPAWHDAGWGGIKIVNVVPSNGARGRAAISSSYILFDRETGEHLLLLDGGELTARRTAAASALAARRLARADSGIHLVIGAGRVGHNIPHAYREVLPIERTLVHDLNPGNARRMVDGLTSQGFVAEFAADLPAAVAMADIVTCATLAKTAVLRGEWLHEGQHVDLIGSFTPEMREADDRVMSRATVYVDTEDALVESGDIVAPMASGVLTRETLGGTLKDLCAKNAFPRRHASQITLFKGVGTAIEDLSAAILAFKSA
jgi:ornithine cyclodeaminase/alanine dehydrogenase-like protein (mu-crystallin family)